MTVRRFTRIGDVVSEYLERAGMNERIAAAGIVPEWADRVGPAIAAVTQPFNVSRGVLVVGVRSSAWLMELHMMEHEIRRKLNAGRDSGRIERVRFVMVEPGNNPRWSRG
jgi:predicted nucleic acid-binding Zn ribbon protein